MRLRAPLDRSVRHCVIGAHAKIFFRLNINPYGRLLPKEELTILGLVMAAVEGMISVIVEVRVDFGRQITEVERNHNPLIFVIPNVRCFGMNLFVNRKQCQRLFALYNFV